MKKAVRIQSMDDLSLRYDIDGDVPGWRFMVEETSAGVYQAEGRDRVGRSVMRRGTDPDTLIAECSSDAKEILRGLRTFADNDEFYYCVKLLWMDLRESDFGEIAARLYDVVRFGFMAGEILGALRLELRNLRETRVYSQPQFRQRVDAYLETLNHVL